MVNFYKNDYDISMMIAGYLNGNTVNTVIINGTEQPVVSSPREIVKDVMSMYPNADRNTVADLVFELTADVQFG